MTAPEAEIPPEESHGFRSHRAEFNGGGDPFTVFHYPDKPITMAQLRRLPLSHDQGRYFDPKTAKELDVIEVDQCCSDPAPIRVTAPGCLEFPHQKLTLETQQPPSYWEEYEIRSLTATENYLHDLKEAKRLGTWHWRKHRSGTLYLHPGLPEYPPDFKDNGARAVGCLVIKTKACRYIVTSWFNPYYHARLP